MSIKETVRQIVEPLLAEKDIELIKVDFLKSKGKYRLILTVDKFEGNIGLDEIAQTSNLVSSTLDEKDVIKNKYDLEVSSPGLERPLNKISDFERFKGKLAKVILIEPVLGQSFFKGRIAGTKGETVMLEVDNQIVEIDFINIKRSNLVYDIREDLK